MAHEFALDGTPAFRLGSCYWHARIRHRLGEHLSQDELACIGHTSSTRAPADGVTHRRSESCLEVGAVLAAEAAEILAVLMGAEHRDAVEFLA